MDEQLARNLVLMRAIETADREREILSEEDRTYASRSAKELAHWQAADHQTELAPEYFLQQRAEQILKRIAERYPAFAAVTRQRVGWRAVSIALPIIALLTGAIADRLGDPHRVDLLAAPLLLIIGWNLVVYIGLLIAGIAPSGKARRSRRSVARFIDPGKLRLPRKLPRALTAALLDFSVEWASLSRRLIAVRVAFTVHLASAMFALGAVLSLYARGLLSQYRVGWESTFLDAGQVHAILAILFAPAIRVLGLRGFSVSDIEALRFGQSASAAGGAHWVHLYAATLFLLVMVPRLLLATIAWWQAKRLQRHFPLPVDTPYFRRLTQAFDARPAVLRVLPYSFTLDEARDKGLNHIAATLFGDRARVMLRPPAAYGEDPKEVLRDVALDDPEVTATVVLFNLAATPEQENHGAFLDYLVRNCASGVSVLVDDSAFRQRIGLQADDRRITDRITLWREFCNFHGAPATFVNLAAPDTEAFDGIAGLPLSVAS